MSHDTLQRTCDNLIPFCNTTARLNLPPEAPRLQVGTNCVSIAYPFYKDIIMYNTISLLLL